MTDKSEQTFGVYQGEMDGYPLIAIIDRLSRSVDVMLETPWFLSVETQIMAPTAVGLPGSDEVTSLNSWEDEITATVSDTVRSLFVGRVTWNCRRELLYYLDSPEPAAERLQKLVHSGAGRPLAFRIEYDEAWGRLGAYAR